MAAEGTAEIVVVDDEVDLREAVSGYLARQGLAVRTAGGGTELRALLAERGADAVILDIAMPGEDGLSIARSLRAQSDIGIVMLTASADVVDRVVGLEVGALPARDRHGDHHQHQGEGDLAQRDVDRVHRRRSSIVTTRSARRSGS